VLGGAGQRGEFEGGRLGGRRTPGGCGRVALELGGLILVGKEQLAPRFAQVPLDVVGEHAQEDVAAHQAIAPELRSVVGNARRTLETVEHSLASDAPLQQGVQDTLHEVSRATASLRALTDYLKRHPEALIRGKKEDLP
jgi:hypothetical protein